MKFVFQNPFDNPTTRMNRALQNLRKVGMQTAVEEVEPDTFADNKTVSQSIKRIEQNFEDSLTTMQTKVAFAIGTLDAIARRKKLQRMKVQEITLQIKLAELEIGALFFGRNRSN